MTVSSLTADNLERIVRFTSRIELPTFCENPEFAEAGMLLSYGPDVIEAFKLSAKQVHRILKGAKPADVPFEQPTKFELVVNMKTAKALDLVIPESIMLRATRLIR